MRRLALSVALCSLVACGSKAPPAPVPAAPAAVVVAAPQPAASAPEATPPAPTKDSAAAAPACRPDAPATLAPALDVKKLPRSTAVDGGEGAISQKPVFAGTVYQRGGFALGPHTQLVVPANALVGEGAPAGRVEVFVGKRLGFHGHPPAAMSAASVRRNLGLATKEEGAALVLSTYGEFDTHIEGGAQIALYLRVPAGVAVTLRHALFGDDAPAAKWPASDTANPKEDAGRVGYWYAPVNPAPGWKALALQDDAQRVLAAAGAVPTLAPCR